MSYDRITGVSAVKMPMPASNRIDYQRDVPPTETAVDAWEHFEAWLRKRAPKKTDEKRFYLFIRLDGGWIGGEFIDLVATIQHDGTIAVGERDDDQGGLVAFFRVLAGLDAFVETNETKTKRGPSVWERLRVNPFRPE